MIFPASSSHQVLPYSLAGTRRQLMRLGAACTVCAVGGNTQAQDVIRVGLSHPTKRISSAAAAAQDGDVMEVEAGEYRGHVAVWTNGNITLKGMGGKVRLVAGGMAAKNEWIWVVRGDQISVEDFDFIGARVADKNGADIRLEKRLLSVRDCTFTNNQNGILTGNNSQTELRIQDCEFGHNGHGDGLSHNLYVGEIAQLTVTGSYS